MDFFAIHKIQLKKTYNYKDLWELLRETGIKERVTKLAYAKA